ncbi:hypothetical protein J7M28_04890, partial [bacterium]|nr:hypothetical protein [bacterium]
TRAGDWYEAADIYRDWATSSGGSAPPWCKNGPKRTQSERTCAKWLQEEVALATFGISSRRDQSAWLGAFHKAIGAPVFHILGFDWETIDNSASDAGLMDLERRWLNLKNVAAIRKAGDYFAVFKVDFWLSKSVSEFSRLRHGETGHHFVDGGKSKVWMCPLSPDWQNFYVHRDRTLTGAADLRCDALYNDISVCCAAPLSCLNPLHGHPSRGKSATIVQGYRALLNRSHEACAADKGGKRVPIGTEVITENLIDVMDFCQSRAMAGIQGAFEWKGDPSGRVTMIPMFDYVYHEFGPVRLDGFAKASRRFGDIFYFIAARVYLYGAILELNYEFSALELFEGMKGSTHYLTYDYWTEFIEDQSPQAVCSEYLEFASRMASARVGFGCDYLCWGKMMPPLPISSQVPKLMLDYDHYNVFKEEDSHRSGVVEAEAVVTSGWRNGPRLGFFMANISSSVISVECVFDPTRYGFGSSYQVDLVGQSKRLKLLTAEGKARLKIEAPPRDVVMLEVLPLTGSRAASTEKTPRP